MQGVLLECGPVQLILLGYLDVDFWCKYEILLERKNTENLIAFDLTAWTKLIIEDVYVPTY
jgi:hypothetical protein